MFGATILFLLDMEKNLLPPKEVYKDPLPEDIIYDDKIADYSFSTPDVRSSVMVKRAFRKRIAEGGGSGWAEKTDAEMLAEAMHSLTNNPAYLNQPIFVPKDAVANKMDNTTAAHWGGYIYIEDACGVRTARPLRLASALWGKHCGLLFVSFC